MMKYIVCQQPGTFLMKEKPAPQKTPGEALVRVKKVGICGTDLHAYAGNQAFFSYPRILGHELAAEILEIETNPLGLKAGDRVVVMPYISCHACAACRTGKTNCCRNIRVLGVHTDGGMQEIISVPVALLLPATGLSEDEMAIVEPLAIGAHAIQRAGLQEGETVVVIGCGPIGIGIMKLAQLAGATVIAIDRDSNRLAYAREEVGADQGVLAGPDAIQRVADLSGGDMAAVVFDATGNKGALESGVQYIAHGGRYVLVGLSKGDLVFNHPMIHAREASILCSRNATREDFMQVIALLRRGEFPTGTYITHRVAFEEMIAQFDRWQDTESGVIKALVTFG